MKEKEIPLGPAFGGTEKFQNDPYWRDCLLFYEYFHGDNGAGIGASHQTGWTGVIPGSFACSAPRMQLHYWKEECIH
jgi:hypothetical protein